MKLFAQILFAALSVLLLAIHIDTSELQGDAAEQVYFEGEVLAVSASDVAREYGLDEYIQTLDIELHDGERAGETIVLNHNVNSYINAKEYAVGDQVVLVQYTDYLGSDQLFVMDYVRRPSLLFLFAVFVGLVLVVNRKKGAYSLLSMGFSFLVLFKLVLPLLLLGYNPVLTALLGSLLMLPALFYLSHGFNRKTSIAIGGTLITLTFIGLLSMLFTDLAQLSGLASEEAGFLKFGGGENIDFRGLLLAGMIISVLGILDDVCITQTSVVEQLKAANKRLGLKELYRRAMHVGRDHISSVVNTLILVYTGASLPLLLLFINGSQGLPQVLNYEFMAEEIVRTLVGSVGLIVAVPITTLIASFIFIRAPHESLRAEGHGHSH